jgi:hypothetical protein
MTHNITKQSFFFFSESDITKEPIRIKHLKLLIFKLFSSGQLLEEKQSLFLIQPLIDSLALKSLVVLLQIIVLSLNPINCNSLKKKKKTHPFKKNAFLKIK